MITDNIKYTIINPNSPAMPITYQDESRVIGGLTIRQHFAAMAMQGMLSNPEIIKSIPFDKLGETDRIYSIAAVEHADALIAELNKTNL